MLKNFTFSPPHLLSWYCLAVPDTLLDPVSAFKLRLFFAYRIPEVPGSIPGYIL